jgi:O-methyltransferase
MQSIKFRPVSVLFVTCIMITFELTRYRACAPDTRVTSTGTQAKYLKLMEMALTGSLHDETGRCNGFKDCNITQLLPYDPELRRIGNDWPPFGHTMVGHLRLQNIKNLIDEIVVKRVPGDFAELGVWRGGSCIYAKAVFNVHEQHNRRVYVFDAFDSLRNYGISAKYLSTSEATVRHNFNKYGVLDDRVVFIKGLFKTSVPDFRRSHSQTKIAVLRLDGNFYDSHQDALYYLYELVPVGGYVIFDDIRSHPAVQQSWTDFQQDQGFSETLINVDNHAAYFMKTKKVKVNFAFFKPPRDVNV